MSLELKWILNGGGGFHAFTATGMIPTMRKHPCLSVAGEKKYLLGGRVSEFDAILFAIVVQFTAHALPSSPYTGFIQGDLLSFLMPPPTPHTHSLSLSLCLSHTHHTLTLSVSLSHTHSLCLSLTHSLSLSLCLSHTYTHTHFDCSVESCGNKYVEWMKTEFCHTHTHSLCLSVSLTHILTHTHTLTAL